MKAIYLCVLIFLFPAPGQAGETITFSAGSTQNSFQPSLAVPLLREAFRRNGYVFKVIYLPSARSLQSSNSGLTSGELHRVANLEKVTGGRFPNLVRIETPLLSLHTFAYARVGTQQIRTWKDLDGTIIAYKTGRRHIRNSLGKLSAKTMIFPVTSDIQAFEMLARQRVEFVITEREDANAILASHPDFKNIRPIAQLQVSTVHAYMNRKYTKLAVRISQTLAEMKTDGTFQTITNKAILAYDARQRTRARNGWIFPKGQNRTDDGAAPSIKP